MLQKNNANKKRKWYFHNTVLSEQPFAGKQGLFLVESPREDSLFSTEILLT